MRRNIAFNMSFALLAWLIFFLQVGEIHALVSTDASRSIIDRSTAVVQAGYLVIDDSFIDQYEKIAEREPIHQNKFGRSQGADLVEKVVFDAQCSCYLTATVAPPPVSSSPDPTSTSAKSNPWESWSALGSTDTPVPGSSTPPIPPNTNSSAAASNGPSSPSSVPSPPTVGSGSFAASSSVPNTPSASQTSVIQSGVTSAANTESGKPPASSTTVIVSASSAASNHTSDVSSTAASNVGTTSPSEIFESSGQPTLLTNSTQQTNTFTGGPSLPNTDTTIPTSQSTGSLSAPTSSPTLPPATLPLPSSSAQSNNGDTGTTSSSQTPQPSIISTDVASTAGEPQIVSSLPASNASSMSASESAPAVPPVPINSVINTTSGLNASVSQAVSPILSTVVQTLPSTVVNNGTSSITMVFVTIVTTLYTPTTFSTAIGPPPVPINNSGTSSSETFTSLSPSGSVSNGSSSTSQPASSVASNTASITATPGLQPSASSIAATTTSSSQPPANGCSGTAVPWCVVPTTIVSLPGGLVTTSTMSETSLCACPMCMLDKNLCHSIPLTQTTSCPEGWLCSLSIPYPTSSAWLSLPSGVIWHTSPSVWSELSQTITNTKSSRSTDITWIAALSTSTSRRDDDALIIFPIRVWRCIGPLCDPDLGLQIIQSIKCFFTPGCNKPFQGFNGFPPPPFPVPPPIAPPELDFEINPTTFKSSQGLTTPPSPNQSPTQSASSCSPEPVTACSDICSTVIVSPTLSETCRESCTTFTKCDGTDVDTTTTLFCTNTVTFEEVTCTNTTIAGQATSSCETYSRIDSSACQGSTTTSFIACTLNRGPVDSSLRIWLESLAAQVPFSMTPVSATLTSFDSSVVPSSSTQDQSSISAASAASVASMASMASAASMASISSESSRSQSAAAASISSQSLASSLSASVASKISSTLSVIASAVAFPTPHRITPGGPVCMDDNPSSRDPDNVPADKPYMWFGIGLELPIIIANFCRHIGASMHLGSQYYDYSQLVVDHAILTSEGRNVTLSVKWNPDACYPVCSRVPFQPDWTCPENTWWQASWEDPWGQDPLSTTDQSQLFCKHSFERILSGCGAINPSAHGGRTDLTSGGFYFTQCLQWTMYSPPRSPTFFWPFQGNGTQDFKLNHLLFATPGGDPGS